MSNKNMHLVFFTEHGSNRPTRKWVTQKQFDSYVKAVRQQREKMLKQE